MGIISTGYIKKLGTKGDVEGLVKALSYPDDIDVREAAVAALAHIGDADRGMFANLWLRLRLKSKFGVQTISPIIDILEKTRRRTIRKDIVNILNNFGSPAIELLCFELSNRKNIQARLAIVNAIEKINLITHNDAAIAAIKEFEEQNKDCLEYKLKRLRQSSPGNAVCYLILLEDLPFTYTTDVGECIACCTEKSEAETMLSRCPELSSNDYSLLGIENFEILWEILNTKAIEPSFHSPYGLLVDWLSKEYEYSTGELISIGFDVFRNGLSNLPPPNMIVVEGIGKELTASKIARILLNLYARQPDEFLDSESKELVRKIGHALNSTDGFRLMRMVHEQFASRNREQARSLEREWSGIGGWRG